MLATKTLLASLALACLFQLGLAMIELEANHHEKHWLSTCASKSCEQALQTALDLKCIGKKQCTSLVKEQSPECAICVNELITDDNMEEIENGSYFVCYQNEKLHELGCQLYCRVNYFPFGSCLPGQVTFDSNLQTCKCSNALADLTSSSSTNAISSVSTDSTTTKSNVIVDTTTIDPVQPFVKEEQIFLCDLDDNPVFCGGLINKNGTSGLSSTSFSLFLTNPLYKVTDVSSIIKPAANGLNCKIPFVSNENGYYHCTISNECETEEGLSKCAEGKFHYSKTASANIPYVNEISIPTVEGLEEESLYSARIYMLFDCNDDGCEEAEDFIGMRLMDGRNEERELVSRNFYLADVGHQRKWIQKEIQFRAVSSKVNVFIYLGRRVQYSASSILAIDNFEIFKLNPTDSY